MDTRYLADGVRYTTMTAAEMRDTFLITTLFTPGEVRLVYCEADRAVIGSAVPLGQPVALVAGDELRAAFFCQRRELGVLNIGGRARCGWMERHMRSRRWTSCTSGGEPRGRFLQR